MWAFCGKAANALAGLVLAGLLARLLPPAQMGLYFLAFNLATFFSILGRAGLEHTLTRFIAQACGAGHWGRLRSIYLKGISLVLGGAGAAGLLAAALVPHLAGRFFNLPKLSDVSWLIGVWAALLAIQFTMGEIFRGFQKIGTSVWVSGLTTATLSVALLGLASRAPHQLSVASVLLVVVIALAINNSVAFFLQNRLIKHRPNELGVPIGYSELLTHSWPLLINAITTFALSQSDLWLLGKFATEHDLAIYGAASRIVMLTAMPLAIINMVVPPLIARMHDQNDLKRLEYLLRTAAAFAGIPALMTLAVFIFGGGPILGIVYGDYYRAGAGVLTILCAAQVVNVLVGSCGYVLVMTGHRKTIMYISIASAVVAVLLGFAWVQTKGVVGLASAYAIAIVIQQIAMWLVVRQKCGIWTHAAFSAIPSALAFPKGRNLKVPDIYIIGAQKSGTTSLYDWLAQHPEIYAHPHAKDYPYFSDPRAQENGISLFCSFVRDAPPNCVTLGGDVNAMYASEGAQQMNQLMPDAKLIAVLRNPIQRAYSAYAYAVERLMEGRSFEQAINDELSGSRYELRDGLQRDYLKHGCYADQLNDVFAFYSRDRVKIVLFEDLANNSKEVMRDLYSWIGVAENFAPNFSVKNETRGSYRFRWMALLIHGHIDLGMWRRPLKSVTPHAWRRSVRFLLESFTRVSVQKPEFPAQVEAVLRDYYSKEIESVEKILGRRIDVWRS